MDATTYYVTTLTNAALKLGPIAIFLVVGWFIFFKLPFLFFLRNMGIQKKEFEQKKPDDFQKDYSIENYKDFQRRMKLMGPAPKEGPKQEKTQEKKQETKRERRQETRQEKKEAPPKRPARPAEPSAENIFSFATGEVITKAELKKRYHELLRQNHPDRVASMGEEFKKLAEKNTKEINKAYDKLKNKAA